MENNIDIYYNENMNSSKKIVNFSTEKLEHASYDYVMIMNNLNREGGSGGIHQLASSYKFTPAGKSGHPCVLDAVYNIDHMEYTSKDKRKINWSFFEKKKFSSVLFNSSTEENRKYLSRDSTKELIGSQWSSINSLFSTLPKLPVTGIVHAFVYDLIGMDQTISHILSCLPIYENAGMQVCIKSLSDAKCDLSVELYDRGTNYNNGTFYASYLGDGMYMGREQRVFEFMCDKADFNAGYSIKAAEMNKSGYSYYSGTISVDVITGILGYCRMNEMIFSNSDSTKEKSAGVLKRFVDIRATEYTDKM